MNSTPPLAIPNSVEKANQRFLKQRDEMSRHVLAGQPGLETAHALRKVTDEWLCTLWRHALPKNFEDRVSLHAIGGYGRDELAIHSDIDIFIALHDSSIAENQEFTLAMERLMAWSRHTRLSISHAVRTADQALDALDDDPRSAISLLDIRHLDGPAPVDAIFSQSFVVEYLRDNDEGRSFVTSLIEGLRRRIARYGQTVFLLEPDVKSGEGGLRDLNCIAWAARVRWRLDAHRDADESIGWTESDRNTYCDRLDALLALRNRLHLLRHRKHDRLAFRDQEALVRLAEYATGDVLSTEDAIAAIDAARSAAEAPPDDQKGRSELAAKIEAKMAGYYRRARAIALTCERCLRRWAIDDRSRQARQGIFEFRDGQLSISDEPELTDDAVFDALVVAGEHDLLLDPRLEARLEEHVQTWPEGPDTSPIAAARLRELLVDPHIAPRTSRRLLDLGILERILPEFKPLICHVHHDLYHVYTTDVHSLKCLEEGRALLGADPEHHRRPFFCRVAAEIGDTTSFLLACLFHDIGKNRGGEHSRKGAEMMNDIGPRLGLDTARTSRLSFLVRHHLVLSTTSRRRDISDPEIIEELVDSIADLETLHQLTALTYCDMSTVGPEVMNDWKASLLIELYGRLKDALVSAPCAPLGLDPDRSAQERERCRRLLRAELDVENVELLDAFVDDLPEDHLVASELDELTRQYDTYRRAFDDDDGLAITLFPIADRGVTEVIVSAPDRPGTLARIAGAIASTGVNIMAADIVTTTGGRTLDIFHIAHFNPRAVPPVLPRPVETDRRLERIRERIVDVLCDRIDLDATLERRRGEQRLMPRPVPAVLTEVHVDEEASSHATVIEVRAPDRQGLLYSIANTLVGARVNTLVSRIDSLGHQAIDTFYVEELDGSSLSPERIEQVLDALRETLAAVEEYSQES